MKLLICFLFFSSLKNLIFADAPQNPPRLFNSLKCVGNNKHNELASIEGKVIEIGKPTIKVIHENGWQHTLEEHKSVITLKLKIKTWMKGQENRPTFVTPEQGVIVKAFYEANYFFETPGAKPVATPEWITSLFPLENDYQLAELHLKLNEPENYFSHVDILTKETPRVRTSYATLCSVK